MPFRSCENLPGDDRIVFFKLQTYGLAVHNRETIHPPTFPKVGEP
jgi:hypothetical protein